MLLDVPRETVDEMCCVGQVLIQLPPVAGKSLNCAMLNTSSLGGLSTDKLPVVAMVLK
jgi:hypothetical protein